MCRREGHVGGLLLLLPSSAREPGAGTAFVSPCVHVGAPALVTEAMPFRGSHHALVTAPAGADTGIAAGTGRPRSRSRVRQEDDRSPFFPTHRGCYKPVSFFSPSTSALSGEPGTLSGVPHCLPATPRLCPSPLFWEGGASPASPRSLPARFLSPGWR